MTTQTSISQYIPGADIADSRHVADFFEIVAEHAPVTPAQLAGHLGVTEPAVNSALSSLADDGYLDRDEFGRYSNFCPWPRPGF